MRVSHYRYSESDVLGEGSYGAVFRAYDMNCKAPVPGVTVPSADPRAALPADLQGCRVVALKQMSGSQSDEGLSAATMREIAILKELAHTLRSDQRPDTICRLGGIANYAANRPASSACAGGGGLFAGEGAESSLTDQGNTSETVDDAGVCSTSPTPSSCSPQGQSGGAAGRGFLELERRLIVAEGRQYILDMCDVIFHPVTNKVFIALDFCEGGDAWHYLRGVPDRRIKDPAVFRRWVREMLLGVAFMHSKHISHRDLKPQNIMLKRRPSPAGELTTNGNGTGANGNAGPDADAPEGDQFMLKVADFGLSREEDIPVKKYVHEAVTLWYRSPDVLLGNTNYSYSVDAWSLGCIVMEMASGAAPFRGKNETDQLKRIFARLSGPFPEDLPSLAGYPHSEQYAPVLQQMAEYHEQERRKRAFTAVEEDEYARLVEAEQRERLFGGSQPCSSPALLRHVAGNKARLRQLLKDRGGGIDVLGEDGLDLVARFFVIDPQQRLSVLDSVDHPFMRQCLGEEAWELHTATSVSTGSTSLRKLALGEAADYHVAVPPARSNDAAGSGREGSPVYQRRAVVGSARGAAAEYTHHPTLAQADPTTVGGTWAAPSAPRAGLSIVPRPVIFAGSQTFQPSDAARSSEYAQQPGVSLPFLGHSAPRSGGGGTGAPARMPPPGEPAPGCRGNSAVPIRTTGDGDETRGYTVPTARGVSTGSAR